MAEKIFLDPTGSERFKGNINALAQDILEGIENETYVWDDENEGYVVDFKDLNYDFPGDEADLAVVSEALADAIPEQLTEMGYNVSIDGIVTFNGDYLVVS